jgi:hypothetical protein
VVPHEIAANGFQVGFHWLTIGLSREADLIPEVRTD